MPQARTLHRGCCAKTSRDSLHGVALFWPDPFHFHACSALHATLQDGKSVPAGGDAYVMKHVIHDWDDGRARDPQERRHCHGCQERPRGVARIGDSGGAELFAAAGFRLTRVVPTASPLSVVEAMRV